MSKPAPFRIVFTKGQRVRLTEKAHVNGVTVRARANGMGTVVSQPTATTVRVLPDGYKNPIKFSVSFWEAAE